MRKFIFNASFLNAVLSGFGIIRSTIKGPRDWRLIVAWVGWIVSLIVAVGAILTPDAEEEFTQAPPKKKR